MITNHDKNSKDKEALKFLESDRIDVKLTHNDFNYEQNFDFIESSEELRDFLISKVDWEGGFDISMTDKGQIDINTKVTFLNESFNILYNKFKNKMDSVELFHIFTDFYDLNPTIVFNTLVYKFRVILKNDLCERIGKISNPKNVDVVLNNTRVQSSFHNILKSLKNGK